MSDFIDARAIVFEGVGDVRMASVTVPVPGPGEVLIETAFTALSPGTERRCLAGRQAGAPPFPLVPGYALTGTVQRVGADVALPVGTPVFCAGTRSVNGANRLWGGHISHAVRPVSEVFVLPDALSLADAALAQLAAIAYHGVRFARPLSDEPVAVVGLGVLGLLSARLFQEAGCSVLGIDPLASRREHLSAVGSIDEAKAILPDGVAIVVDATGVPAVLEQSLALARSLPWDDRAAPGARIVIQGSYPETFPLSYDSLFQKELTLLVPRNCQPRDVKAVLELLARRALNVTDLYALVPVADAVGIYTAAADSASPPTVVFDWQKGSIDG